MLKASALYMVIVIALVIAIFSGSLIATAYYYRLEYQKSLRYNRLYDNLKSGEALLLSDNHGRDSLEQKIDLFGDELDSVLLKKERWGVFDVATVQSFKLNDTLRKAFFIAKDIGQDFDAIYLTDEDRPVSVSGTTHIAGDVRVPKAGIKTAYVEGKPYAGKEPVNGTIKTSSRELLPLDKQLLDELENHLNHSAGIYKELSDSLSNSFFNAAKAIRITKTNPEISNIQIDGKVVLLCDTVLRIKRDAVLQNVLVFAPGIVVEEGFEGSCQLFASDSVVIAKNCLFRYPSVIGVLKKEEGKGQPQIVIGQDCRFAGILFTYEKKKSELQTVISLGKNSLVTGEVYATGFIKMEKPLTVQGKVSCNRFIIQTPSTLYENYLIDITINRTKRSPYYLSSPLFGQNAPNRVLKWLD